MSSKLLALLSTHCVGAAPSLRHFLTSACGERLSDTEVVSLCEAWAAEDADVDGVEALRGFVRWLFQGSFLEDIGEEVFNVKMRSE